MKKIYVSPRIETNDFMLEEGFMVVTVESSGNGLGFGGSDGTGSGAPEAKQYRYSVWDEEE